MSDNLLVLGSNSGSSEAVFVFQGAMNQERAERTIEEFTRVSDSFLLRSAFLIPDNASLGGDTGISLDDSDSDAVGLSRWPEILTGATIGAVVGGFIGSVIPVAGTAGGAIIGGAIGDALVGGGTAYIVDVEADPESLEYNYGIATVSGVFGGVVCGFLGAIIGGGGLLPPIPGTPQGGACSPYAKVWRVLKIGE